MIGDARTKSPSVAVLLSGHEQFSPYYGGAVARWTYEVYSRLQGRAKVTVFGFPTKRKDLYSLPHETSTVCRTCNVIARIPVARRYEDRLWLRTLVGRLRQFDVVHIHNRPQWVSPLRRMGYGGAIVLHLHNDHLGHWTISQLDSLARGLNAVAVCSDYLHRTFAKKSTLLAAKSRVIFNGANLELLYPRYEAREPKTILFVGRLDPEKGVLQLLQAYEKVLEMHPDAKLVIGGSTGYGKHKETIYVQQVQELANRLTQEKSAQILFTGYLDHEKGLLPWLQRATIFVSPSLVQETFGLVNAEAMACATTVVSSNRGGIPEVVGEAGRLVDPEDVEQLAATISELLSAPSLCRRLGEAGYERCRKMFDWSVIAQDWITLLENVARSSKNS